MIIDTIDGVLDALYDEFETADQGEDYALGSSANQMRIHEQAAKHWQETIEASRNADALTFPALLAEGYHSSAGEADPNLKVDALLRLAATALVFAASVERQVAEEDPTLDLDTEE